MDSTHLILPLPTKYLLTYSGERKTCGLTENTSNSLMDLAEQQLGLACVTHLGQHILRSYRKTTYNDDNDDESIAGSIQWIDLHKRNWRETFLAKIVGNAH
eukprot:scaffold86108_cov78-Cyclotella_meneghiniana.AAC.7